MFSFFLNLPASIKTIFVAIIVGFLAFTAGDYKGHIDERNSLESKQKDKIIAQQAVQMNVLNAQYENTLQIVQDLNESNNQLTQQYNLKQKELQDEAIKNHVNELNVITGGFLRYISATVEMPTGSKTPSATYADTARYKATDTGDGINTLIYECQMMRNNYIALQNWNRDTWNNYNLGVSQ